MAQISEIELERYDMDLLKKIYLEGNEYASASSIFYISKDQLIKMIMLREKWSIMQRQQGKSIKQKKTLPKTPKPQMEVAKYIPPHLRKESVVSPIAPPLFPDSSDEEDDEWKDWRENDTSGWGEIKVEDDNWLWDEIDEPNPSSEKEQKEEKVFNIINDYL